VAWWTLSKIDLAVGGTIEIGSWVSTGKESFALTFFKLAVDNQGNLLYTAKFRLSAHLTKDSTAFNSAGTFAATDPTGKVLFSGTVQIQGTRMQ
jgi:hypothetical protein